jgi:hypothetical protein
MKKIWIIFWEKSHDPDGFRTNKGEINAHNNKHKKIGYVRKNLKK